jgi:hypothetical protein
MQKPGLTMIARYGLLTVGDDTRKLDAMAENGFLSVRPNKFEKKSPKI